MTFCPRQFTSPDVKDISGLASKPYPRGQGETRLGLVCDYVDVFPDELPELPP